MAKPDASKSLDASLIELQAHRFSLPARLVTALVLVESGGDPWAFRFEPKFLDRYVPVDPARYGPVSVPTERMGLATSWGLCQIMGLTARERGFRGAFLSELCDPEVGLYWGCLHLAQLKNRYGGWMEAVAAYNAGSPRRDASGNFLNQVYVTNVLNRAGGLPA